MKSKIVLAGVEYTSKKAALAFVANILHAYRPGETVRVEHKAVLLDLFSYHVEWESKCGCGVESIQVEKNFITHGFWLTRIDGTRTDISYIKSLSPPSHEAKVRAAFRTAIAGQVAAFRSDSFFGKSSIPCAVTGEMIESHEAHVDHEVPFKMLVDNFLYSRGFSFEKLDVVPTQDGKILTRLVDKGVEADWAEYHKHHAKLRMVKASVNLGLLRRKPQQVS